MPSATDVVVMALGAVLGLAFAFAGIVAVAACLRNRQVRRTEEENEGEESTNGW